MKKQNLMIALSAHKALTQSALQTLYNSINKGQRKQLVKKAAIKELFDRYEVEYEKE